MTCAEVASVSCKIAEFSLIEIQLYYGLSKKIGADAFISSPKEVISSVKSLMIAYKISNSKSKSIEYMDTKIIEKCLAPAMKDVTFFTRDYRYATVEVRFSSVEKSRGVRKVRGTTIVLWYRTAVTVVHLQH